MAGLAPNINFRPGGVIGSGLNIEVFLQVGGVAVRAHVVPVEVFTGPVQDILVVDRFIGIKMIPALSSILLGPTVPAQLQHLNMAPGKLDHVLLQRINPQYVVHLEICILPIRSLGIDEKLVILPEEPALDPEMFIPGIIKVPENGIRICLLHGQLVVGAMPVLLSFLVAFHAG